MPRITEFYAWIIADKDEDDEGVPAFVGPGSMMMPMVAADQARVESLRPIAQNMANESGKDIKLVRFNGPAEVLERLVPEQ